MTLNSHSPSSIRSCKNWNQMSRLLSSVQDSVFQAVFQISIRENVSKSGSRFVTFVRDIVTEFVSQWFRGRPVVTSSDGILMDCWDFRSIHGLFQHTALTMLHVMVEVHETADIQRLARLNLLSTTFQKWKGLIDEPPLEKVANGNSWHMNVLNFWIVYT
jgi:hypothetical protein